MLFALVPDPQKTTSRRSFLTDGTDSDDTQTNDIWMYAYPQEED